VPFIFRIAATTAFDETLSVLREIRSRLDVPVAIQVHDPQQVSEAAKVADLLQIPAARCRQRDLLAEAAHTGRPVNIEMASLLPTEEAIDLLDQVAAMGNWNVTLTDCRTRLNDVVDGREFTEIRESGFPLVVDAGARLDLAEIALRASVDGIGLLVEDEEKGAAGAMAGVSVAALPPLLSRLKNIERAVKRT
jgi:3-deoxy-D-manno-octulosonic acid (KDO) 8-phosphate synthase